MPWDQREYDAHARRVPAGHRLAFAPEWGYFVQKTGNVRNLAAVAGYHRTAKAAITQASGVAIVNANAADTDNDGDDACAHADGSGNAYANDHDHDAADGPATACDDDHDDDAVFADDGLFLPAAAGEDVCYLDPPRVKPIPTAAAGPACPACGEACPADYDAAGFVGITRPTAAQRWTEVWRCACGTRYRLANAGQ